MNQFGSGILLTPVSVRAAGFVFLGGDLGKQLKVADGLFEHLSAAKMVIVVHSEDIDVLVTGITFEIILRIFANVGAVCIKELVHLLFVSEVADRKPPQADKLLRGAGLSVPTKTSRRCVREKAAE